MSLVVRVAEQAAHLGLPEPAVPAGGTDRSDAAGGCPSGHGLGVDPEQGRYLSGSKQPLSVGGIRRGRRKAHRKLLTVTHGTYLAYSASKRLVRAEITITEFRS
jgi:hypothetical protein